MEFARQLATLKKNGDHWRKACRVLYALRKCGGTMTSGIAASAISAFGDRWKLSMALFEKIQTTGQPEDEYLYTSAIASLGKGGEWKRAISVLEQINKPSVTVYATAISAVGQSGKFEESLKLLDVMKEKNVSPNNLCYCAAISACGRVGQWQQALKLLDEPGAQGTRVTNAAMFALAKAKKIDEVFVLLDKLVFCGTANLCSFNTALKCCHTTGNYDQAIRVLKSMREENIEPNDVTRICALAAARNAPFEVLQEVQSLLGMSNFDAGDESTARNLANSNFDGMLARQESESFCTDEQDNFL